MQPVPILGEFEQLVLLAILRLEDHAYGVSIREELERCTGRAIAPGALYTTLDRLAGQDLVGSRLGEATPERGGRAKRFYKVTKTGVAALTEAHRAFRALATGLSIFGESHA